MHIVANGKSMEIAPCTLYGFIKEQGYRCERTVVEYNLEVVRQEAWHEIRLRDGDRIEIVSFVGGG